VKFKFQKRPTGIEPVDWICRVGSVSNSLPTETRVGRICSLFPSTSLS